ncbi:hypothetical protein CJF42_15990 [Pseudoalteromonas sp. NBT06-2]|uniref:DUF1653 domain-containing protein n=1 Tax=Pseudoalteromonas sp. NBT06-2 TaxID=2025950 RepID=UPI000BA562D4|nr:DUF1653 domain-containing protein [Pseudoalteromonas sp. NBT06-2]PAJ73413.1 hypothetical protein CJF42_15990 [Pseudoalteromonas sp. NBT06-2]
MIKLGRYRHFKGNFYQVLHLAKHSETQELLVVYQPEYGEKEIWVRPLDMFDEMIEREGKTLKRFSKVEDTIEKSTKQCI